MLLLRNTINGWIKSRSFLPELHPKVVFKSNSVIQSTLLILNAIQLVQHTLACLLWIHAFQTAYTCYKCASWWQKNNFADSRKVQVKNFKISSCCWWRFPTATSAIHIEQSLVILICYLLKSTHGVLHITHQSRSMQSRSTVKTC